MIQDLVNGLFEGAGGLFILSSIIALWRSKTVSGISWLHIGYFSVWGAWNLYYYPHLGQTLSFWGGIGVFVTNTVYLAMLICYGRRKN